MLFRSDVAWLVGGLKLQYRVEVVKDIEVVGLKIRQQRSVVVGVVLGKIVSEDRQELKILRGAASFLLFLGASKGKDKTGRAKNDLTYPLGKIKISRAQLESKLPQIKKRIEWVVCGTLHHRIRA